MMYVFKDYLDGGTAVFDSIQKADDFAKKLNNHLFEEVGCGLDSGDYEIVACEINPDFEKWIEEK